MKIQAQPQWQFLSTRQLTTLAPTKDDSVIRDLVEKNPDSSAATISERLQRRSNIQASNALVSGTLAGAQLLGGLVFHGTVLGNILYATGAATAAVAGYNVLTANKAASDNRRLSELGEAAAQTLVTPGNTPDTFIDGRFYSDGNFANFHEVRSCSSGEVLSRHAELSGKAPLQFDQDVKSGQVTIKTIAGTQTFEGELLLPKSKGEGLNVIKKHRDAPGATGRQKFEPHGLSTFEFTRANSSNSNPYYSREIGFTVTGNQLNTWENGNTMHVGEYRHAVANPLVHAQELGEQPGILENGTVAKTAYIFDDNINSVRGWESIKEIKTAELERGAAVDVAVAETIAERYRPSDRLTLIRNADNNQVTLTTPDGTSKFEGSLSNGGTLSYKHQGIVHTQSLAQGKFALSAQFPGGRVDITQTAEGIPQAELYWGDASQGKIAVRQDGSDYKVNLNGVEYSARPAVPARHF